MINKRFLAVWDVIPGENEINDLSNDKLNLQTLLKTIYLVLVTTEH
jgi:hypothetical protein